MKAMSLASEQHLETTAKPRALDRLAERLVRKQLEQLRGQPSPWNRPRVDQRWRRRDWDQLGPLADR